MGGVSGDGEAWHSRPPLIPQAGNGSTVVENAQHSAVGEINVVFVMSVTYRGKIPTNVTSAANGRLNPPTKSDCLLTLPTLKECLICLLSLLSTLPECLMLYLPILPILIEFILL